jgi:hypothetical protein
MKTNGDKFLQYMFGWYAGAGHKSIDPKRAEHADINFADIYMEGWRDGKAAGRAASEAASKRFDYKPSIIRTME